MKPSHFEIGRLAAPMLIATSALAAYAPTPTALPVSPTATVANISLACSIASELPGR